ncbi:MAG TPA: chemotaxis protein CheW [Candidatus Cloacimonadota bacterium]|jgi:purine-binding chemotaxis protein CheW|nr:chemotaxis protein CheW [Candidatus Cloacimonadales bacterium]HPY95792.1 chemotaxis protein CheW [Candidatus Cloacimonadota bacterium]HQB40322.1 chemotaxis protein CheW [Candidatus Cloacimonadota bacterium]
MTEAIKKNEVFDLNGKYLSFNLLDELYGINVDRILQIIAIPDITPIPKTPDFVKGVINLRGKIIPVIDLRKKIHLPSEDYTDRTSIVIIKVESGNREIFIGTIVDKVLEVMDISQEDIENTPDFGIKLNTEYIAGIAKVKGKVITLLNINRVLTEEELSIISKESK